LAGRKNTQRPEEDAIIRIDQIAADTVERCKQAPETAEHIFMSHNQHHIDSNLRFYHYLFREVRLCGYVFVPRWQGCLAMRGPRWFCQPIVAASPTMRSADVRMDQGPACDRGHLLDGRHALSAAAVRLSLRGGSRIEAVRNLQGDGKAVAESDHQSGDDRDLA